MARNPNVFAPLETAAGARHRRFLLGYRLTREPVARAALRRADRVVFVSEAFRAEVGARLGLDPAKTRVVHHGLSGRFAPNGTGAEGAGDSGVPDSLRGRPYLLSVSTIAPHKNYETVLDAYADVVRRSDRAAPDLAIAGGIIDPALHAALVARARSLGIAARVHFLGRVPYDRLPALYQHAAGLVLASRLETFGHPLVEAMASGVPVVTSALPVCREICGDAALYFDPDDAPALAEHLSQVLASAPLRDRLRTAGLARARHFSWDRTARDMIEIFAEVVR
jgi:glycosyltransferase involved in cell wall biosynthesis